MKCKINNLELEYFKHGYNNTATNERHIEVPIGFWFLDKFHDDVTEVGAVLPYYGRENHRIVDQFDEHPKSQKLDAFNLDYSNCNLLSISTIEHFGTNDYHNKDINPHKAVDGLLNMIKAKNFLITYPLGINKYLDNYLKNAMLNVNIMILKRLNYQNEWTIHPESKDVDKFTYGKNFHCAEAIVIISNLEEFKV